MSSSIFFLLNELLTFCAVLFLCRKTSDSVEALTAIRKQEEGNFMCIISECNLMSHSMQQQYGDTNPLISQSYCSHNLPATSIKSTLKVCLTILHFLDYYNSRNILFVMKGSFFDNDEIDFLSFSAPTFFCLWGISCCKTLISYYCD